MATCYLRYVIDPYKLEEFERYGCLRSPSRGGLRRSGLPRAMDYAEQTRCIVSYERSFLRPVFDKSDMPAN